MTLDLDVNCLKLYGCYLVYKHLNNVSTYGTLMRTGGGMGIPKIKSASELRKDLYSSLKEVAEGEAQVITHKQGEPVVLISQSEFNKLSEEKSILKNLEIGLQDIRAGRIHSTSQIRGKLAQRRKERDRGGMV